MRRIGSRVRVWTKWVYSSDQSTDDTPKKVYRQMRLLQVYDCAKRSKSTLQQMLFADELASSEAIFSVTIPDIKAEVMDVPPETMPEIIMTSVCKSSAKRPR